jgi:hypothetical protein
MKAPVRTGKGACPSIGGALVTVLLLASPAAPCRAYAGPTPANVLDSLPSPPDKAAGPSLRLSLETSAAGFEAAFPFEYAVATYQTQWSKFSKGDRIVIRAIRGNRAEFEVGGLYAVMGTYALASMKTAVLGLFTTTADDVGETPTFRHQMRKIPKGSGTFLLWCVMTVDGAPHVSFYPPSHGSESCGGVYFEETSFQQNDAAGKAHAPSAAEPVFKFYLPREGNVKIGQPIFRNFVEGQAPQ